MRRGSGHQRRRQGHNILAAPRAERIHQAPRQLPGLRILRGMIPRVLGGLDSSRTTTPIGAPNIHHHRQLYMDNRAPQSVKDAPTISARLGHRRRREQRQSEAPAHSGALERLQATLGASLRGHQGREPVVQRVPTGPPSSARRASRIKKSPGSNFHPGGLAPSGTGGVDGSWSQQLLRLHFRFLGCFGGGNSKP